MSSSTCHDGEVSSCSTAGPRRERHFTTSSVPSALDRDSLIAAVRKGGGTLSWHRTRWGSSIVDTVPSLLWKYRNTDKALTDADDKEILACTTDRRTLSALTIPDLKDMLRALGAKVSGKKSALIDRVVAERRKAYEVFAETGESGREASAKKGAEKGAKKKKRGRPKKVKEDKIRVRKKKRVRKKRKRTPAEKKRDAQAKKKAKAAAKKKKAAAAARKKKAEEARKKKEEEARKKKEEEARKKKEKEARKKKAEEEAAAAKGPLRRSTRGTRKRKRFDDYVTGDEALRAGGPASMSISADSGSSDGGSSDTTTLSSSSYAEFYTYSGEGEGEDRSWVLARLGGKKQSSDEVLSRYGSVLVRKTTEEILVQEAEAMFLSGSRAMFAELPMDVLRSIDRGVRPNGWRSKRKYSEKDDIADVLAYTIQKGGMRAMTQSEAYVGGPGVVGQHSYVVDNLADELLVYILSFCDPEAYRALSTTCSRLWRVGHDFYLLRLRLLQAGWSTAPPTGTDTTQMFIAFTAGCSSLNTPKDVMARISPFVGAAAYIARALAGIFPISAAERAIASVPGATMRRIVDDVVAKARASPKTTNALALGRESIAALCAASAAAKTRIKALTKTIGAPLATAFPLSAKDGFADRYMSKFGWADSKKVRAKGKGCKAAVKVIQAHEARRAVADEIPFTPSEAEMCGYSDIMTKVDNWLEDETDDGEILAEMQTLIGECNTAVAQSKANLAAMAVTEPRVAALDSAKLSLLASGTRLRPIYGTVLDRAPRWIWDLFVSAVRGEEMEEERAQQIGALIHAANAGLDHALRRAVQSVEDASDARLDELCDSLSAVTAILDAARPYELVPRKAQSVYKGGARRGWRRPIGKRYALEPTLLSRFLCPTLYGELATLSAPSTLLEDGDVEARLARVQEIVGELEKVAHKVEARAKTLAKALAKAAPATYGSVSPDLVVKGFHLDVFGTERTLHFFLIGAGLQQFVNVFFAKAIATFLVNRVGEAEHVGGVVLPGKTRLTAKAVAELALAPFPTNARGHKLMAAVGPVLETGGTSRVVHKRLMSLVEKAADENAVKLSARLKMEDTNTALWFAEATADDLATVWTLVTVLESKKVFDKNRLSLGEKDAEALLVRLTNRGTIVDWRAFEERKDDILALIDAASAEHEKRFLERYKGTLDSAQLVPVSDEDLSLAVRNAQRLGFSLGAAGEDGADSSDVREALKPVALAVTAVLERLWSKNPDTQAMLRAIRLHRIPHCQVIGECFFVDWLRAKVQGDETGNIIDWRPALLRLWRKERAAIFPPQECLTSTAANAAVAELDEVAAAL